MGRGKLYEFAGKTGTLPDHARRFGVSPALVSSRVNRCGWSLHEAIHFYAQGRSRMIDALGERLTINQWSARSGLTVSCIKMRLRRGWPPDEAVSAPATGEPRVRLGTERVFEWNGEEYNIAELARAAPFPIKHEQMRRRLIVYGWPIEKAMSEPVREYGRK